jgi:hypothetical protein
MVLLMDLGPAYKKHNRRAASGQLGGLGVLRGVSVGVAEEARTRSFATPAFAECAFIFVSGSNVGLRIGAVKSSKSHPVFLLHGGTIWFIRAYETSWPKCSCKSFSV